MPALDDMLITVRHEWKGWRQADVRLLDVEDLHWSRPDDAPHPMLHGYVLCTSLSAGTIPHDCGQTEPPHRLLICVLKHDCVPTAFAELSRRAERVGCRHGLPVNG
jgi:hypothetical protein